MDAVLAWLLILGLFAALVWLLRKVGDLTARLAILENRINLLNRLVRPD